MNDFSRQWEDIRAEAIRVFDSVGESGWYIMGQRLRGFEKALGGDWGHSEAVGVGNGLDAIELALRAAGLQPGDKVLTSPLSAFATTLAIIRAGGVPVFCDTDSCGLLDMAEASGALRAIPGIRFFVPVHLYGFPMDPAALKGLIDQFGLICIEDCAQSIGASSAGVFTGTTGVAAATSFYPTKNLGAMGDGGAVLTSDAALASRVRRLRDYGQSAKYQHTELGMNSRLDELQAALLGEVFLPRLNQWTERRREIAARYLGQWPTQKVRPLAGVAEREWHPSWHLFPVRLPIGEKPKFLAWLRTQGISAGEHYPILIPDQHAISGTTFAVYGTLAHSRALAAEEVSLPIHPYMTDHEVEAVLSAVARF